ncbi:MAG: hypothetical protein KDC85_08920 [Saprospiraceae bacterium]|nr:hypothetical protein [Saprospiraceae bacterium]MCB9324783.1 hypothetical protein [Lewinellaceae bacterium]
MPSELYKKLISALGISVLLAFFTPIHAQHSVGLHFAVGKSYSLAPVKPAGEKGYYSVAPGFDYQFAFTEKFFLYSSLGLLSTGRHTIDSLKWGSETDNMGNYVPDPSLPHKSDARVFQLFGAVQTGIKYYLTEKRLRLFIQPYLEGDVFLSNRNTTLYFLDNGDLDTKTSTAEPFIPKRKFVFSAGFGIGAEWALSDLFSVYLIADAKLMTTDVTPLDKANSIIPAIKTGLWYNL